MAKTKEVILQRIKTQLEKLENENKSYSSEYQQQWRSLKQKIKSWNKETIDRRGEKRANILSTIEGLHKKSKEELEDTPKTTIGTIGKLGKKILVGGTEYITGISITSWFREITNNINAVTEYLIENNPEVSKENTMVALKLIGALEGLVLEYIKHIILSKAIPKRERLRAQVEEKNRLSLTIDTHQAFSHTRKFLATMLYAYCTNT